jgi:hypothetical protein
MEAARAVEMQTAVETASAKRVAETVALPALSGASIAEGATATQTLQRGGNGHTPAIMVQRAQLRTAFDAVDTSGVGTLGIEEVGELLKSLGETLTADELQTQMAIVDADGSGELDFEEFAEMIVNVRTSSTERKVAHAGGSEPAEAADDSLSEADYNSPAAIQERIEISKRSKKTLGVDILDLGAWSIRLVDTARNCALLDGGKADEQDSKEDYDWERVQKLVLPSSEVRGTSNYAPAVMPPEALNAVPAGREFNLLHWVCLSCAKGADDDDEVELLQALLEAGAELNTSVRSGSGPSLQKNERKKTARELLSAASSTSWDGSELDPMLAALFQEDHTALLQVLDEFDTSQGRALGTQADAEPPRAERSTRKRTQEVTAPREARPKHWSSSSSDDDDDFEYSKESIEATAPRKREKPSHWSSSSDDE